ncbi:MAG TPA: helix-turn-helix domain-containing protein [Candidatus Methanofastidiosa archaeon]|nr:helix-turn-helix domain-containing protein [Candidatus Methanofastidiosa archaeon]
MHEVLIKACSDDSFLINIAKDNGVDYKVLQLMPTYDGNIGGTVLCEFNTSANTMEDVISSINSYSSDSIGSVAYYEVDKKTEDEYFLMLRMSYYIGFELFLRSGCLFNGCRCNNKCITLDILTCGNNSLYDFINTLKERNYTVEIMKKRNFGMNGSLTNRQKCVLKKAYDLGYFDIPKRISLKELSGEIGVSPSSTDEIIKRAQKKIISGYLMR